MAFHNWNMKYFCGNWFERVSFCGNLTMSLCVRKLSGDVDLNISELNNILVSQIISALLDFLRGLVNILYVGLMSAPHRAGLMVILT